MCLQGRQGRAVSCKFTNRSPAQKRCNKRREEFESVIDTTLLKEVIGSTWSAILPKVIEHSLPSITRVSAQLRIQYLVCVVSDSWGMGGHARTLTPKRLILAEPDCTLIEVLPLLRRLTHPSPSSRQLSAYLSPRRIKTICCPSSCLSPFTCLQVAEKDIANVSSG